MQKRISLAVTAAIPVVAMMVAAPASAAPSCKDNIADIQKQWDKVYHRESQGAHPQVADNFRIAKELCAKADETGAQNYADVVRSHLNMPVMDKGGSGGSPVDTLHSDGPSTHHDPQLKPAMGGKPGKAPTETMHSDGPSTHHDPQLKPKQ